MIKVSVVDVEQREEGLTVGATNTARRSGRVDSTTNRGRPVTSGTRSTTTQLTLLELEDGQYRGQCTA